MLFGCAELLARLCVLAAACSGDSRPAGPSGAQPGSDESAAGPSRVQLDGYQSVQWDTDEREVRKRLKPTHRNACELPRDRASTLQQQELGQPMHAIRNASSGAVAELLTRLIYPDKRRGIDDLFHVDRIASGCGLFFKGRYFGQLNVAKEQLDEGAMVVELSGKLGPAAKIGGESFYHRTYGGAHNVYRFDVGNTVAFLVYWEDAAATMYLSSRAVAEMETAISAEIDARIAHDKTNDAKQRAANTKRVSSDL